MLRVLIENDYKSALAGYKANVACATGMGVAIDDANGKFVLPTAETGLGVYVVDKARVAEGVSAAKTNFSDYDTQFNAVAAGEFAVLNTFDVGEEFAVDAYDATTCVAGNAGKYATVGTDGKWKAGTEDIDSKYIFVGLHTDAGHTLAHFRVTDNIGKNS